MSAQLNSTDDALDGLLGRLVHNAVILTDGLGAVSKWSEPADLLFGRGEEDVLGRSLFDTLIAAPLGPDGEGWQRFLSSGDAPEARARVELQAQHSSGHAFAVELVFVPVRLEEGFDFSLFLEDLAFELEPAQMLARLRVQHPVVVRALKAALADAPQPWDPAWRASGTLVVFRALCETPWVDAECERRAREAAEAEAARLPAEPPAPRDAAEAIAGYADASQIIERLLGAVHRLDALEATATDLPAALEAATARAEAAEREARAARAELEEQRTRDAETARRLEAGHGQLREQGERLARVEQGRADGGGEETDALRALLADVSARLDALTATVHTFQAGFEEARQAAVAARREAEEAREASATAGAVTARSAQKLSSAWQKLLAPREATDHIRTLPARRPAAAPPERPRRAGFDDAAAPMAILALDGHFREINPGFATLVGYPEQEFTKAVWPSAHDRRDYREQVDQLHRLAAGQIESVTVRSTYMHGQGLMIPVRGTLSLLRDAEGAPERLLLRAEERSSH